MEVNTMGWSSYFLDGKISLFFNCTFYKLGTHKCVYIVQLFSKKNLQKFYSKLFLIESLTMVLFNEKLNFHLNYI